MDRKVFGIGCPRTGTKSLGRCFEILGFRNASWNADLFARAFEGDIEPALRFAAAHESFEDLPWCMIYADLDRRFPGSRFVLTVRKDTQTWLRSFQGHHAREFGHRLDDEGRAPDGSTVPVWPDGVRGYERHNDAVRAYFRDRPRDLLEISWERGDGWEKLCGFLRVPVPPVPVPHENRTGPYGPE
jgi:hypothetical protein